MLINEVKKDVKLSYLVKSTQSKSLQREGMEIYARTILERANSLIESVNNEQMRDFLKDETPDIAGKDVYIVEKNGKFYAVEDGVVPAKSTIIAWHRGSKCQSLSQDIYNHTGVKFPFNEYAEKIVAMSVLIENVVKASRFRYGYRNPRILRKSKYSAVS